MNVTKLDLVLVGAKGGTNVGESLHVAAQGLGLRSELIDIQAAWSGPWPLRKVYWHLLGHRPVHLESFGRHVVKQCAALQPRWMLSVGIAPLAARTIRSLRGLGIRTLNFLTDDPYNPAHRAPWALRAEREYDTVLSPRRANMSDLSALGCRSVRYVPFGYDPRYCFPEAHEPSLASDVIFVGGADADRVPWVSALFEAGIDVAIYGAYWDRFLETRGRNRGQTGPDVLRRATASAKIALCLVRRANRDGHVMRSLEIPAIGACMLVEDTEEHRALFGADGECVYYFRSRADMVERVRWLLARDEERARLAAAVHERIAGRGHRYEDRLKEMLEL